MNLVFRIGLGEPILEAQRVRQQLRDAHGLRQIHVKIERDRRAAQRAAESEYADLVLLRDEVDATADAEQAAWLRVAAARQETRGRKVLAPLREAHTAAKEAHKEVAAKWRARRKQLREDQEVQRASDAANEAASEARRIARGEFAQRGQAGRPGTYMMVEDAAAKAAKAPLYDGTEPRDPKFRPFRGEGRIGEQIHDGDLKSLRSNHTFLRLDPPPPWVAPSIDCGPCRRPHKNGKGWTCPPRAERTNGCKRCCPVVADSKGAAEFGVLRLRVGTDQATRGPIWAAWPMRMHRALPEGAVVVFAAVSLRKIGPREVWSAELTVKLPTDHFQHELVRKHQLAPHPDSVLAVDVGWRKIGDELRVAAWRNDKGEAGELRLSSADISALRKTEELHSGRDKDFNAARDSLITWLCTVEMPEWMRLRTTQRPTLNDGTPISGPLELPSQAQALAYLAEWKSPARLASLARAWAENRWDGDSAGADDYAAWQLEARDLRKAGQHARPLPSTLAGFTALEAWREHDYHLWQWEASQRAGSLGRRKDLYRCFAAAMSRQYHTLVLEDFDLRVFARRKPKESETAENETARSNRHMAALSELRLCMTQAFRRCGQVVKAPCRDTTRRCNVCGVIEKFDAAKERTHVCQNGHRWDQDDNAGVNLLEIWCERPGDCQIVGAPRKDENESDKVKESPRVKAKRMATERRERLEVARGVGRNPTK